MNPKFIQVKGHKIACYESNSEGYPVIMLHGNSLSANTFRDQIENDLFSSYRIISFDFPGHGLSENAKDPEKMYTLSGYADLVAEFVKKLNVEQAVFVGHSLGGHVTLHSIEKLNNVIKGIAIFGTPPISIPMNMEVAYHPNPAFVLAFKDSLTKEELLQLAGSYINQNGSLLDEIAESISTTDPKMRIVMGESTGRGEFIPELEVLNNSGIPIAVLHGEKDSMINPAYFTSIKLKNFWRNSAQLIKDSGHCPQIEKPDVFNKILIDFLDDSIK